MKIRLLASLIASSALVSQAATADPIQVFIMAGQSNMVGSGSTADLPTSPFDFQAPQPGILYSYDLGQDPELLVSDGWETLRPSVRGEGFGSEITFGKAINDALSSPIAILKQAHNGSSLFGDWNPDAPEGYRQIYPAFIDHVQTGLASLGTAGVDYEVAGMFWQQGESDMSLAHVFNYEDRLTDFIATVRADLGIPGLRFFIGAQNDQAFYVNKHVIRQAQADIAAADPNAYYIETSHLPLKPDAVHLTSAGQMGLGEAYADFYLSMVSGDLDGDGFVGIDDLNIVLGNWNATPAGASIADPSGDGFVGIDDVGVVLNNWNEGQYGATPASVPEPSSAAAFLAVSALLATRANRASA